MKAVHIAARELKNVMHMDSSIFPCIKAVHMLEAFPPGEHPTNNNVKANSWNV